jgi:YVTN family beta-propeller protein
MTLSRWASLFISTVLICFFVAGCGETFRPVVTPIPQPGPDPQGAKNAIVLSQAASGGGVTTHLDVSADVNIGQARVGPNPVHAATIASGSRVAIANNMSDSLSIYATSNPASQSVVTVSLPVGARPSFLANNAATGNMFITMSGLNAVGVVSVNSALFTNQINLDPTDVPVAIAVTPDGNKAYSANSNGTVTAIDARALNVIARIPVGGSPNYVVSSADSAYVYVVNGGGQVHVIKTSDNSLQNVGVGSSPSFAFFDPRLLRVYVPNTGSNNVSIINADPNAPGFKSVVNVTVGTAPKFVTALADGSKAYVSNSGSANVSVINTLSNAVAPNPIAVGNNPTNIISSPDSTKVAVLNVGSNSVSSIRVTDDTVAQTIPLPATVPQSGTPGIALTPVYMISQQ